MNIETTLATLEQRLGRPLTEEEAAAELNVSLDRYRHMLVEAGTVILSLDAPLNSVMQDEGLASLTDLLEDQATPSPSDQVEQREMVTLLKL